jgi:hypothetical protein
MSCHGPGESHRFDGLEPLQEDPSGNQKAQVLHPAVEPATSWQGGRRG